MRLSRPNSVYRTVLTTLMLISLMWGTLSTAVAAKTTLAERHAALTAKLQKLAQGKAPATPQAEQAIQLHRQWEKDGKEATLAKAQELFEQAVAEQDSEAMVYLGQYHYSGIGMQPDAELLGFPIC